MVRVDRGVTVRGVWIEPGSLIASVKLVKPDALEQIVLHGRKCGSLIQTTEQGICRRPRSKIKEVLCRIRSVIIKREE
jgi:hypothetical protein